MRTRSPGRSSKRAEVKSATTSGDTQRAGSWTSYSSWWRSAAVLTRPPELARLVIRAEPRQQVVAEHSRDPDARDAHRACGLGCGARRGGGVDAARVRDDLGTAVGDERERAREVRGEIARVATRLVPLPILLQDGQRE